MYGAKISASSRNLRLRVHVDRDGFMSADIRAHYRGVGGGDRTVLVVSTSSSRGDHAASR